MQRAGAPPRADRSARPLGLPRSLAANLNPGPQFCLWTPDGGDPPGHSSQLTARSSVAGTQHTATRARSSLPRTTQSTVLQQQQKQQQAREEAPKAPMPRKELSEATRPTPPSHHSIHPYIHTSSHRYKHEQGRQGNQPVWTFQPDKTLVPSHKELMRLTAAGKPATSECPLPNCPHDRAEQSTISRDLVLGPSSWFWLLAFQGWFCF